MVFWTFSIISHFPSSFSDPRIFLWLLKKYIYSNGKEPVIKKSNSNVSLSKLLHLSASQLLHWRNSPTVTAIKWDILQIHGPAWVVCECRASLLLPTVWCTDCPVDSEGRKCSKFPVSRVLRPKAAGRQAECFPWGQNFKKYLFFFPLSPR